MQARVVELFAGVGGFRLGLERAGWRVVWSDQWEPASRVQHASDLYVARFGPDGHVNDDIERVLDRAEAGELELPDHELLVGGLPCQDYSVARTLNQARGIVGRKGVLWWQFHRLLVLKRPRWLLIENVDRLLKSPADRRGRDFAVMLASLMALGYEVEWRVVNAADYGYPQRRRRVFIVGRSEDGRSSDPRPGDRVLRGILGRALPAGLAGNMARIDLGTDAVAVSDGFGANGARSPFRAAGHARGGAVTTGDVVPRYEGPFATLGDVLEPHDEVASRYRIPAEQVPTWRYLKSAKREPRVHRASGSAYLYAEGAIPFPDPVDRPSRTIVTGEGGATPSRFKHVVATGDGGYRRLTPRELERLNGFPDDWTATGLADGRRAFLMGNALVVGIVERIGQALAEELARDRVPAEQVTRVAS